jgi:hypothetical protein
MKVKTSELTGAARNFWMMATLAERITSDPVLYEKVREGWADFQKQFVKN